MRLTYNSACIYSKLCMFSCCAPNLLSQQPHQCRVCMFYFSDVFALYMRNRLSKEDRELLIADVVSCLAQDKSSLVEVAYEMLYAYPVHENEQLEEEKAHLSNFADQCDVILGLLHR